MSVFLIIVFLASSIFRMAFSFVNSGIPVVGFEQHEPTFYSVSEDKSCYILTGSKAMTRMSGSDLFVSEHLFKQVSHRRTVRKSDLTRINDGIIPLPTVQESQKTCPHSRQWCLRTNILKYVPHLHLSTSLSDCHI